MAETNDMICVGTIAGAFGVQGEVRVKSFTAEAKAIADYAPLTTEDGSRSFDIVVNRTISNGLAVRLSGVVNKEEADALKGVKLFAPRDRLPDLPEDEYYYADLIGLEVRDTGGAVIGTVKSVQNNGAEDMLEVHGPTLKDSVLIPFSRSVVPTVDLATGRIIADPPEGLL
ncbi:ribosome maturation factor RimM [Cognatishimia sp. WU-CL00825]|uniref:ribosome maturation factor RimM n=1 Tax=Cognatishimia sp. WU-CL00825 TaxID=3127658 RepID=UPI003105F6FE